MPLGNKNKSKSSKNKSKSSKNKSRKNKLKRKTKSGGNILESSDFEKYNLELFILRLGDTRLINLLYQIYYVCKCLK